MFSARTDWLLTPNRLTWQLEERRRQQLPVLDLTESNPTRCGFAADAEILKSLQDPRSLLYEPDPRGLLRAREAVCEYYASRGVSLRPEQVFLTTSTSEAYTYVFRLLADPGYKILVPQPSYPLFDFLAGINDLEVVSYPLLYDHEWRIDLDAVRDCWGPGTKAMIVVHPNNPTGSFVQLNELASLSGCCRENQGALIADEVFADYAFQPGAQRVACHAAASEVLTFTLSGLSKISALPQMKLGWVVASGPEKELKVALERLEVIADTYLSVSAPIANALPALLELRTKVQPKIMERLRSNLCWLDQAADSCPAVTRLSSEGGWYAILKVPEVLSDEEWAVELLTKEGVLVHPGHFYDFPGEGNLVISLLTEDAVFQEGAGRILAHVAKSS
ncbi:MAG: pyridoxal phosphate-dependent aminotransferase [Acidobacteriota bacterium]